MKMISISMAGMLLCSMATALAERPLRIYLPQDVQLDGEVVALGRVGILLGDEALVKKADAITLGTFSVEGQALLVDRNTVLSRLASNGIRAGQVQILGAETVRIRRNEMTVSTERLVACAERYLNQKLAETTGAEATVLRAPQPQVVQAEGGAIELLVVNDSRQGGGVRRITVAIVQDGRQVGTEDVIFNVRYQVRRLVAAEELAPGSPLTSENIRVETTQADSPEPEGWTVPYGMVTRQRIAAGGTISSAMLEPKQAPMVIRRRQNVVIQLDSAGLFVSATGEAMEDGRIGEIIRVRRGRRPQERIINCRVQSDGTVEPVL